MSDPTVEPVVLAEQRIVELIKQEIGKSGHSSQVEPLKPTRLDSKGLQLQVDNLEDIDRCFLKVQRGICPEAGLVDGDCISEAVEEGRKLIKQRIKSLRIADIGGWQAVHKYEGAANLGDDAEDAKKIQKAIDSARSESRRGWIAKSARPVPYSATGPRSQLVPRYIPPSGRPFSPGSFAARAGNAPSKWNSQCFNCNRLGHWKFECPYPQQSETVQKADTSAGH